MSTVVGAPAASYRAAKAGASSLPRGSTLRAVPARISAAFRRWFAAFVEARLRTAAIHVLRHLDERIPYATGVERADLMARANDLRRSLS